MICTIKKNPNPYKSLPSLRIGLGLLSCTNLSILTLNSLSATQLQKDEFLSPLQLAVNGLGLGLCLIACLVWVIQGVTSNKKPQSSSTHLSTATTATTSSKKSNLVRHWHVFRVSFGSALSVAHLALGIWLVVKIGTLRSEGHSACLALDDKLYSQPICYLQILTAVLLIVNSYMIAKECYLAWKLSRDTVFLAARKERRETKEKLRLVRLEIERTGAIPLEATEYRPDLSLAAQEPHIDETEALPMYASKDYRGGTVVDVYGQHAASGTATTVNP